MLKGPRTNNGRNSNYRYQELTQTVSLTSLWRNGNKRSLYRRNIVRDIKIKTKLMNAQPRLGLRPRCWETAYDWAAYDCLDVIQVHHCAACLACVVTAGVR